MVLTKIELAEAASHLPDAPKSDEILAVWNSCLTFLQNSLEQGKACFAHYLSESGVVFPDLGTFSFHVNKQNVGTRGTIGERIPQFKINDTFKCSQNLVVRPTLPITPNILELPMNFVSVSAWSGVDRETTRYAYKVFVQALANAVRSRQAINLDFRVANLVVPAGSTEGQMQFKNQPSVRGRNLAPSYTQLMVQQTKGDERNPSDAMRRTYTRSFGLDPTLLDSPPALHRYPMRCTTESKARARAVDMVPTYSTFTGEETGKGGVGSDAQGNGGGSSKFGKGQNSLKFSIYDEILPRHPTEEQMQDMDYQDKVRKRESNPEKQSDGDILHNPKVLLQAAREGRPVINRIPRRPGTAGVSALTRSFAPTGSASLAQTARAAMVTKEEDENGEEYFTTTASASVRGPVKYKASRELFNAQPARPAGQAAPPKIQSRSFGALPTDQDGEPSTMEWSSYAPRSTRTAKADRPASLIRPQTTAGTTRRRGGGGTQTLTRSFGGTATLSGHYPTRRGADPVEGAVTAPPPLRELKQAKAEMREAVRSGTLDRSFSARLPSLNLPGAQQGGAGAADEDEDDGDDDGSMLALKRAQREQLTKDQTEFGGFLRTQGQPGTRPFTAGALGSSTRGLGGTGRAGEGGAGEGGAGGGPGSTSALSSTFPRRSVVRGGRSQFGSSFAPSRTGGPPELDRGSLDPLPKTFSYTLHNVPYHKEELFPVPGLDPTICRLCKRYSRSLPAPNMCSMCLARARQVQEKDRAEGRQVDDDRAYQEYCRTKDATALDADRALEATQRAERGLIDSQNLASTLQKTRTRSLNQQDAFLTGTVPMGDIFDARPDDEPDEEVKKRLREGYQKQIAERRQKLDQEAAEEREYGTKAREREVADARQRELAAAELKKEKQAEQRAILREQMAQPRDTVPASVGYNPIGDPFTLEEDEAPAVIAERKEFYKQRLQHQMAEKKAEQARKEAEEKEFYAQCADMERTVREQEAQAELDRRADLQARTRAALLKQMAEKKPDDEVIGYDENGDPFTQGESAAEVQQKKLANQRKQAEAYNRQIQKLNEQKEREKAEAEQDQLLTRECDKRELEADRAAKEEHDNYSRTYGALLAAQIEDKRRKMKEDEAKERDTKAYLLSPQIGEAPDRIDCEEPYYRQRQITKKERLIYGF